MLYEPSIYYEKKFTYIDTFLFYRFIWLKYEIII